MRSVIFNIAFYTVTFCMAGAAVAVTAFTRGPWLIRRFLAAHARIVIWLVRVVLNTRVEFRGLERFGEERPLLLVGKHQSEFDAFPLLARWPDLAAIAMEELARYPFIGPVIRKLGYILVSVEGRKNRQLSEVVEGARRVHGERRPILIYPEGELMRLGSRQRYKTGVFHIYQATGEPATPIAVCCGLAWPKREWRKTPHQTIVIELMEPIPPGLDKETFMALIEDRIETRTMELIEEFGAPEIVAVARERHRLGLTNDDEVSVKRAEAGAHA